MDETKQPGIQVDRIFVSRAHLEHGTLAHQLPDGQSIPSIPIQIAYESHTADDGKRGIGVLTVSSDHEEPYFYRMLIEMTALVSVTQGDENMPLATYMGQPLAVALYPFAREAVAALTGRGRHGSVYLKPFNAAELFAAKEKAPSEGMMPPATKAPRKKK